MKVPQCFNYTLDPQLAATTQNIIISAGCHSPPVSKHGRRVGEREGGWETEKERRDRGTEGEERLD